MATIAVMLKIDAEGVAAALQRAGEKLDTANGQMIVDFSSVARIDPAALVALEKFAGIADGRGVKLALRGVNVEVYKVLKLAKLAARFSFLS